MFNVTLKLSNKQSVQVYELDFFAVQPSNYQIPQTQTNSPVQDRLSAAVQVVKLLLCHGVIYIHSWYAQFSSFRELIQPRKGRQKLFTSCRGVLLWLYDYINYRKSTSIKQ